MTTVKEIKAELLEAAVGEKPPQNFVSQYDILDMTICEYFNKSSPVSKERTLGAVHSSACLSHDNADISPAQVKALLDKYAGQDVACPPRPRR